MILAFALILVAAAFLFVIAVRGRDLPEPEAVSPTAHLDERKSRIYEGLRDLQFEFRVGKLSDHDYQRTKLDLQKELAVVMAEIDRIAGKPVAARQAPPPPPAAALAEQAEPAAAAPAPAEPEPPSSEPEMYVCPSCGAQFDHAMKFCGECGKPMTEGAA